MLAHCKLGIRQKKIHMSNKICDYIAQRYNKVCILHTSGNTTSHVWTD